ncbi:MAG: hydrogenase expression/formation protein [Deltaproteobacteria bacterium RIFCSPLOWO2_12_FULL_43_16]|nr:MAG: hydrogenase expression/formation protein [Deltaproteobacteria bacterium GWA2_43_19]OGQ11508.1 MAG: hydrogenase expression/formation protein [Deltaproteobacteria bacterium RIFCSPHIGHO2_02_FULL_43_33]OGQ60649.1 MAG: hydrogenase expression/formation protein [Deltaproteobacteria bacterium RIFCSPLOWO2_12_FULL_43_16]HBR17272.1 hydrogenase expression/formation protein [Deltaproteobacteria bacterium]
MKKIFPVGKLPLIILKRLLKKYSILDKNVIVGPDIGLDAAVIEFGSRYLLAKTDPITFTAKDIGLYTININANDIVSMGGVPRWFLATILLPAGKADAKMTEAIFSQLSNACKKLNISFCGGHTEITSGIDRPIVIGQMLGEVKKNKLVTARGAQVGDAIILTKGIAIEATSIIAREKADALAAKFGQRFVSRCKNFIKKPGIGVLKDSQIAAKFAKVHAMHDPTEGGIATGLHELAIASKVGIMVDKDKIPIFSECRKLCDYFGINPLGAIASGSLLITVAERDSIKVVSGLERNGVKASIIGKVVDKKKGVTMRENGKLKNLKIFERDEITKI